MTGRGQTEHITLTRSAFARMLNSVLYPNPDDSGNPSNPFGPFGPGGPVMQRWLWAALNPQPLPPGPDPYAELSWVALNPQPLPPGPDPYRAAFAARGVISRAAAQYDMAEVLGDEQSERSIIICFFPCRSAGAPGGFAVSAAGVVASAFGAAASFITACSFAGAASGAFDASPAFGP